MSEKQAHHQDAELKLCAGGCGFFGSAATNNLCSKCWKESVSMNTAGRGSADMSLDSSKPKLDGLIEASRVATGAADQSSSLPQRAEPYPEVRQSPPAPPPSAIPSPAPGSPAVTRQVSGSSDATTPDQEMGAVTAMPSPLSASHHKNDAGMAAAAVGVVPVNDPMDVIMGGGAEASASSASTSPAASSANASKFVEADSRGDSTASVLPAVGKGTVKLEAPADAATVSTEAPEAAGSPAQKNRKRCYVCSKKVGYTGIQCKCKLVFCSVHRYPEQHDCSFDFKTDDRKNLEKLMTGGGKFSKIDRL